MHFACTEWVLCIGFSENDCSGSAETNVVWLLVQLLWRLPAWIVYRVYLQVALYWYRWRGSEGSVAAGSIGREKIWGVDGAVIILVQCCQAAVASLRAVVLYRTALYTAPTTDMISCAVVFVNQIR